jgi:hypothetical protein
MFHGEVTLGAHEVHETHLPRVMVMVVVMVMVMGMVMVMVMGMVMVMIHRGSCVEYTQLIRKSASGTVQVTPSSPSSSSKTP